MTNEEALLFRMWIQAEIASQIAPSLYKLEYAEDLFNHILRLGTNGESDEPVLRNKDGD